jgi:hypothetical protein
VKICGRGHAESALQRRTQIRDDIAEQVVGHDHLERRGVGDHEERQRIDVDMPRLDAGMARRHLAKDALPQRMPLRHRVALVGHADARQPMRTRVVERVRDDAMDAFVGVDLLLHRDFIRRARLESPADAGVQALGVLPKDDEIHVLRRTALQRTQPLVEQADWAVVGVEVQLEPDAEQDVAGVPLIRHARVTDGANENRVVVVPQPRIFPGRQRLTGGQIVLRPVRQSLEVEGAVGRVTDGTQHLQRFRRHVAADPISGNDGDVRHGWQGGP